MAYCRNHSRPDLPQQRALAAHVGSSQDNEIATSAEVNLVGHKVPALGTGGWMPQSCGLKHL